MKVAVSGKGGVGKTTVAALMARRLTQGGKRVLAVDADPDTNLAACLGFPDPDNIIPIVEMKDLIAERMGTKPNAVGAYFKLNPKVSDLPENFFRELNGLKLIVMGMVKRGGAGCACPENTFLKALLSHIILDRDETVIVDMEAGLEHLGRGTTDSMQGLIAVVEPDLRSIDTFERVRRLAGDIGVKNVWCVANRVSEEDERAFVRAHVPGELLIGEIPFSKHIIKSSRGQAALEEAEPPVWEAVDGILKRIQDQVEST